MPMFSTDHTMKSYDSELKFLISSVIEMSKNIIHLIKLSEKSLKYGKENPEFAKEAAELDDIINDIDERVEKLALSVLALRHPLAIDLRFVVSSVKIASLLERMGDRAKYVVRCSSNLSNPLETDILTEIIKMSKIITNMLEQVLNSLNDYSAKELGIVFNQDDSVDVIYRQLFQDIKHKLINANKEQVDNLCDVMTIVRNYERMGDYVSKVAKIIYYVKAGKKIKNFDDIEE